MRTKAFLGSPGMSISGGRAVVDSFVASAGSGDAHWAVVNLGTNDILNGMPSPGPTQEADLAYILDAFHSRWPAIRVVVVTPWYGDSANQTLMANRIANVVSSRAAWIVTIDEATFLSGNLDGIHPTATGYNLTAAAIKAAMGY